MLSVERDCIDHIRARHHVGISVKTANLGKWFPPWTVKRAAWNMALKTNVSGISTAVSFAQCISPVLSPVLLGRRRPTLPLFLPLPCFAVQNVAPDNAQSLSVATQLYPSSPGRRPIALIWLILTRSVPRLSCPAPRWCRWTLNSPGSPVSMVSVDQVVVESPTSYDALVVPLNISRSTFSP